MKARLTVLFTCFSLSSGLFSIPLATADAPRPPTPKDWTVLVYLNGNNSLDRYGSLNLNEMEKVGSTDHVNVVVQWASNSQPTKTRRLYITQDNDPTLVTSKVVKTVGDVDMGDYKSLIQFVKWGVATYPAKHYLIDVWNHGNGWHRSLGHYTPQDISFDDHTGHHITTKELGMALAESARIIGHKVDLYGSDACLMSMAEVATEMAGSVSYFVGSEESEPGEGWPYDALLNGMTASPTANGAEVAKMLTEEYLKSYQGGTHGTQEVTFSAFDLSKISALNASIRELARRIGSLNTEDRLKIQIAAQNSEFFTLGDYHDLSDFLNQAGRSVSGTLDETTEAVRSAINDLVISKASTKNYEQAGGVAIWLPGSMSSYLEHAAAYEELRFNADTHWGDTLKRLLK